MGSSRAWCWILPRRCHFAWHWARQCIDTRAFYIAALSVFFFLGFRQWRSRTDRVLILNMNIRLALFWRNSSWSPTPARGKDSATCAGLTHGRDYSYCRASELKLQKRLVTVFPWIVENTFKQWPTVRVFQPSPTALDLSKERESAQIWIEQHSDFRWQHAKAWKQCQAWFSIDCSQTFQPNWLQMKRYLWKPCSDQCYQDKLRFSILRFF